MLLKCIVQSDELECSLVEIPAIYSANLPPIMSEQKPTLSANIINIVNIDDFGGAILVDIQVSTSLFRVLILLCCKV